MGKGRWRLIATLAILLQALPALAETWLAGGEQWRPYSYLDGQGEARGIAVDVTRQVMQRIGHEPRFLFYPVNRLQAMLRRGDLDLNYADSPLWNSPEELQRFVFSKPYLEVSEHLYFLAGHPAAPASLGELNGLRIGMVRGYSYPALDPALASGRLGKLETSKDLELLNLLQRKRVDAVAMVDDLFAYLVMHQELDPALFRRGAHLSDAPLAIKLQPRHAAWIPQIDAAIEQLLQSGEVARIKQRYLPQPARRKGDSRSKAPEQRLAWLQ